MKLTQLKEMAKRASPDQFYSFGKQMYGAEKVKALSWPEVKAIADKHDILIPAYLRSQKVGRGRFNIVPAEHADAKAKEEPKKFVPLSKPVEPREQARAKDVPTDDVLKRALGEVRSLMKQARGGADADWRDIEKERNGFSVEARYWGHWENPSDAQDEEDYDWQELSSESMTALRTFIKKVAAEYPNLTLSYDIGEKNWITIFAHPKEVRESLEYPKEPKWYIVRISDDKIASGPFDTRMQAHKDTERVQWWNPSKYDIAFGTVDEDDVFHDAPKDTPVPKGVQEAKLSRGEQEAKAELDAFKDFMDSLDRYDLAMVVGRTDPEMGERGIADAATRLKTKAPRIYAAMKKAFK